MIWLFIVCTLGLLVLVLLHSVETKSREQSFHEARTVWKEREGALICVVMPAYHVGVAVDTINDLFRTAYNPTRVNIVCMYNAHNGLVNKAKIESAFQSQVQFIPEQAHLTLGPSVARSASLKYHQEEDYMLILSSNVVSTVHWDQELIQSLHPPFHLISCFPPSQGDPDISAPPTFPVLTDLQAVPCFKGRYSYSHAQYHLPVVSSQCLFGTLQFVLHVLPPPVPMVTKEEDEFLLSCWLFARDVQVGTPTSTLFIHKPHKYPGHVLDAVDSDQLIDYKQSLIKKIRTGKVQGKETYCVHFPKQKSMSVYFNWLGIDFKEKVYAGRIALGLCSDYTEDEIIHKFGSVVHFLKQKQAQGY